MRWLVLVGGLCGGCDVAFGLDDPDLPNCLPADFEQARLRSAVRDEPIDAFSFTKDQKLGIVSNDGANKEARTGTALVDIKLKPAYPMVSAAMEPNGDYFFFTAAIEPMVIKQVRPTGMPAPDNWAFDDRAPQGFMAGTPSDRMFGDKPVRVIVRLFPVPFDNMLDFAEYEQAEDGSWFEVEGHRFTIKAHGGANLSPDGLWIVYDGFETDDRRGVYVRQRTSLAESFGNNRPSDIIFAGTHLHPQLFDDCKLLYSIDDTTGTFALTKHDK